MKTSEILDKAADVIVERGWFQGDYVPRHVDPATCPVCVLAAINVAAGNEPDLQIDPHSNPDAYGAALVLADQVRFVLSYIATPLGDRWNDAPGRTAAQVIAELRAAAQAEREAGR